MLRCLTSLALLAAASVPARAGWIGQADFDGVGSGLSGFNITANGGANTWNGFAGEIKYNLSSPYGGTPFGIPVPSNLKTYCLDLTHTLISPTSVAREQVFSVAEANSRIAWIAATYTSLNYAQGGSAAIGAGGGYSADERAAAVQLSFWNLLYATDADADVTTGTGFKVQNTAGSNGNAVTLANAILAASKAAYVGGTRYNGTYFTQDVNLTPDAAGQNFVGIGWNAADPPPGAPDPSPVPAPPGLLLGLIGGVTAVGGKLLARGRAAVA